MAEPTPAQAAAVSYPRRDFTYRAQLICQRYLISEERAMDILLTADQMGLDTGRPRDVRSS